MFLLKKIAGSVFMPLSLCMETIIIGIFLLWFTRKHRIGRTFVGIGIVLLVCFSYSAIPNALLKPLEYGYPPIAVDDLEGVKWVVVLGGGHISDPRLSANSQLSGATLSRLVEGIRVYRLLPGSKLILSGGSSFGKTPNAEVVADAALALGVDKSDIVLEMLSRDTKDEAMFIRKMVIDEPLVLVTSAAHMPRSMALFQRHGMNPIAAPTDYGVKEGEGRISPGMFFPRSDHLQKAESAFHEYMGLAWGWARGQALGF